MFWVLVTVWALCTYLVLVLGWPNGVWSAEWVGRHTGVLGVVTGCRKSGCVRHNLISFFRSVWGGWKGCGRCGWQQGEIVSKSVTQSVLVVEITGTMAVLLLKMLKVLLLLILAGTVHLQHRCVEELITWLSQECLCYSALFHKIFKTLF